MLHPEWLALVGATYKVQPHCNCGPIGGTSTSMSRLEAREEGSDNHRVLIFSFDSLQTSANLNTTEHDIF